MKVINFRRYCRRDHKLIAKQFDPGTDDEDESVSQREKRRARLTFGVTR